MNDETMRFTFPRLDVPADPEKVKTGLCHIRIYVELFGTMLKGYSTRQQSKILRPFLCPA